MMPNQVKWIEHKERKILYINLSDLYGNEYVNTIIDVRNFLVDLEQNNICSLANVRNTFVNKNVLKEIQKTVGTANNPFKKVGVTGVTKVQEIFIEIVKMTSSLDVKTFDTMEKAKDWLVE